MMETSVGVDRIFKAPSVSGLARNVVAWGSISGHWWWVVQVKVDLNHQGTTQFL